MQRYLRMILTMMAAIPAGASAQTPPPPIEGPVYVATYVEVVPTAMEQGAVLLKQYRDASRKDAGNQRMELVQELGRPSRFAVLAIWQDQKAFELHANKALREKLKPIQAAPFDDRVHSGLAVAAKDALRRSAVVVLTHVDVPPPFKDTTISLLQQLAEASRKEAGNQRF